MWLGREPRTIGLMAAARYSVFFDRFRSVLALVLMVLALSVPSDRFLAPENG